MRRFLVYVTGEQNPTILTLPEILEKYAGDIQITRFARRAMVGQFKTIPNSFGEMWIIRLVD